MRHSKLSKLYQTNNITLSISEYCSNFLWVIFSHWPTIHDICPHSFILLFFHSRFTSGNFQYIDTARVPPKIAYTPTNTPPKTPQIPHFEVKPFKQPNYIEGVWNYPDNQEPYTGPMPAHLIPVEGFTDPTLTSSRGPVEVDQSPPPRMEEPMEIECLDSSPGTTIRSSRRGRPLEGPPGVNRLQASPGARRRGDGGRLEDAPTKQLVTNGHQARNGFDSSQDPQTVEITLSGRSRSRQDLCPDVPRPKSRFEHAVWRETRPWMWEEQELGGRRRNVRQRRSEGDVSDTVWPPSVTIDTLAKSPGILRRRQQYGLWSHTPQSRPVYKLKHSSDPEHVSDLVGDDTQCNVDRRWLSSDQLIQPWLLQDRWWLSGRSTSFLDSDSHIFGRKKVFLIARKTPKSESDVRMEAWVKEAVINYSRPGF